MSILVAGWKNVIGGLGCAAALTLVAGAASAENTEPECGAEERCCETVPEFTELQRRVADVLRVYTFRALPEADRLTITAKLGVENLPRIERAGGVDEPWPNLEPQAEDAFDRVAEFVDRDTFFGWRPIHQKILVHMVDRVSDGLMPVAPCFAEGTDDKIVGAFNAAMLAGVEELGGRYQQTGRWGGTALNPGGSSAQGTPTTLTYGYAQDGTFVPNLIGVTGNSDFQAWMDGIYGSQATWGSLFDSFFAEWDSLSGNTYIFEPNDDGSQLNTGAGISGVRADLRIAAIFIDGNSGVLAYNNFPQDGDMVFDSADNFYNTISNNSQRLRNVALHEHGHGFGALHVCPINQTKLMEPFISTAYTGAQLDDILNIQRHYGDSDEDNNTSGSATSLGTLGNGTTNRTTISIDDNSDIDYYAFTITSNKQVDVTMQPIGGTYLNDSQSCGGLPGNCCAGISYNSATVNDLRVEIIDTDGSTVLDLANDNGAGLADTANAIIPPGTYFARISSSTNANDIQLYSLAILVGDVPFIPANISVSGGVPSSVPPGVTTDFTVVINPGDETITPGSELFLFALDGVNFTPTAMTPLGGNSYLATLPAPLCTDTPKFWFTATASMTGTINDPPGGGGAPYQVSVGIDTVVSVVIDDAEINIGWTVSGTAVDGQWDRGVPVNAGRGDPPSDADGSGQAWLTDNDAGNAGNSDVDNGNTILTSPTFDLSNGATVSYQYWFNDIAGGPLNGDSFDFDISVNGVDWVNVRSYTTADASWRSDSIEVGIETATSSTVRFRFVAEDVGTQNVVEGGMDDFRITVTTSDCIDPPGSACSEADLTTQGAGAGDPGFGVPDGQVTAADINFYINAWVAGDLAIADVTTQGAGAGDPGFGVPDGLVTAADVNYYVNIWVLGCP